MNEKYNPPADHAGINNIQRKGVEHYARNDSLDITKVGDFWLPPDPIKTLATSIFRLTDRSHGYEGIVVDDHSDRTRPKTLGDSIRNVLLSKMTPEQRRMYDGETHTLEITKGGSPPIVPPRMHQEISRQVDEVETGIIDHILHSMSQNERKQLKDQDPAAVVDFGYRILQATHDRVWRLGMQKQPYSSEVPDIFVRPPEHPRTPFPQKDWRLEPLDGKSQPDHLEINWENLYKNNRKV